MTDAIYLWRNGEADGPYTVAAVRDMVRNGKIAFTDQFAFEGGEEWREVEEIMPKRAQVKARKAGPTAGVETPSAERMSDDAVEGLSWIMGMVLAVALLAVGWKDLSAIALVGGGGVCVLVIYFIPLLVAIQLKHRDVLALGALNVFLGWTLVGWVIALVWALKKPAAGNG